MDEPAPTPELFVARDRARRFALRLEQALEDRKFAYLGTERGMTALVNGAEKALATLQEDVQSTTTDIEQGRLRDRERGYMEIPLLVLGAGLLSRVQAILALDRARARGVSERAVSERRVIALLKECLLRIHVYTAAYDEKRPAGPRAPTELAHLLRRVEEDARDARGPGQPEVAPFDRTPPTIQSDPALLEDLLRAVRSALPAARGPWRVEPAGPARPLTLSLGAVQGEPTDDVPPDLERAHQVLAFLHPVELDVFPGPARSAGLLSAPTGPAPLGGARIEVPDEAAGGMELSLQACAGEDARIPECAEHAVRALLASPPAQRNLALAGLLRALDQALEQGLLPRTRTHDLRHGAALIPREATRKAGVRKDAVDALSERFTDFPVHVIDEVVRRAAEGRLTPKHVQPAEAAALLALFGRRWRTSGRDLTPTLDLAPLDDAAVESVVEDLCLLITIRRDLEAGRPVPPTLVTRLERASLGVLGRLGRLAAR